MKCEKRPFWKFWIDVATLYQKVHFFDVKVESIRISEKDSIVTIIHS